MKKCAVTALFMILCALVIVSSCSYSPNTTLLQNKTAVSVTSNNHSDSYQIALVLKTLTNPFFVNMEKGAREAEGELGIQLIVKTGALETSIDQQIQIVEELILQQVDAIVIAPGSSVNLVKVLKKAQDAGIKIINIDNRLNAAECEKQGLTGVPFISVKNDDAAYLSAKTIASLVSGPAKAVIVEGIRDAENAELRKQGAVKAFGEFPNIEVIASESANWKIDEAHDLAVDLFTTNPDIRLVFCANDMMALGVIEYLREADRRDVLVAGFDNLEDMQTAIRDGWAYVTIDQQAFSQGYTGIVYAVNLLKGIVVDDVTYVEATIVTKDSSNQ